jgi:hypothetical protein
VPEANMPSKVAFGADAFDREACVPPELFVMMPAVEKGETTGAELNV